LNEELLEINSEISRYRTPMKVPIELKLERDFIFNVLSTGDNLENLIIARYEKNKDRNLTYYQEIIDGVVKGVMKRMGMME
jgi:hypothetical protein